MWQQVGGWIKIKKIKVYLAKDKVLTHSLFISHVVLDTPVVQSNSVFSSLETLLVGLK